MHEQALIRDVMRKLEEVAGAEEGRIVRVRVRLGALSHFTPDHFREHFADAAPGTRAEGAVVDAWVDDDTAAPHATGVLVESVDVAGGVAEQG